MKPLYTIGHTRKPLRRFISLLREARVDAVIDIRRCNTSQLAGFAKRDDLAFLLHEGFAIAYAHCPELAPSDDILRRYRQDRDWESYQRAFSLLMEQQEMLDRAGEILAAYARACLLCAEEDPLHCHRRLLADALAAVQPGTEVIHLR